MKLYSIRDTKMSKYKVPVASANVAVITRDLTEIVNNPETQFSKYPSDFELFELGEFDESNGKITLKEQPEYILTLNELQSTGADQNV